MSDGFARHPLQARVKPVIDLVFGGGLLVLTAPLMLVTAVWILLESGRPVFFVHPRAGKGGAPFSMFKFRSLIPDALEANKRLSLSNDPFGLVKDDPRFTRSGRFLRRTGIDELPQLLNVLRGEMSIVGPRPDLVDQAAHYTEVEARRLSVRPGITGWSQIHGREDMTWPERFRYDAWYLEHWSLWLDLKIFVRTFAQFFRPEPVPVEDTMNIERAQRAREKA